jgi:hypothetical protein
MDFLSRLFGEAVREDQFVRAIYLPQQSEDVSGKNHARRLLFSSLSASKSKA